jgi:wobble nucleotide-excising tRNase
MLKAVEKIKKLGTYKDYIKSADFNEFSIKNLIYGWNYSGKTTLSRIFSSLENKSLHPDFKECEFTINTNEGKITEKNLSECNLLVRVFNSDFTNNNLFFDSGSANAILLLGKESEEAQKKIGGLSDRLNKCIVTTKSLNKRITEHSNSIQETKTKIAENIRQRLKIYPYTAFHIGNDIPAIKSLGSQLLKDKELADAIELALTPDSKKPTEVPKITATPSIDALYKETIEVMIATPTLSNTIKHLHDNPELEIWIENGLHFHPEPGICEFCGNEVNEQRLDILRSHFSKDFAAHKAKVQELLDRIKIAELKIELPKSMEINAQFREAYDLACIPLSKQIEKFNQSIQKLILEITGKLENPRKAMNPSPIAENLAEDVVKTIESINTILSENNQLSVNFVSERATATQKAKYHFVQGAADTLESNRWAIKITLLEKRISKLSLFLSKLKHEISHLQAEISQAQQGGEKINERLISMLGNDAVQIKVIRDKDNQERFQLTRRDGGVAKYLSDGERTAIAFSYFITKLKELSPTDFKNAIVYIDDPISSLDSNHIFQVTAAINDLFFVKDASNSWKTTCKQLFISTHNFEFFNLVRELKPNNSHSKLYLIKRTSDGHSHLENMPKSLAQYNSEYQYIFDCVYRFYKSEQKADYQDLIILPNVLRRFVELYTFSRIPSQKDVTVDHRADELFGKERAKSILKFLHTFSHGNSIERISGNNELIFLLEDTVKAVFDELQKNDERHWGALIAATQSHS